MRQRPTFRGFGFVLLMIILISMAAMLPRQGFADRISNQEFMTMLTQDKDQIDQVTIRQNSQAPTGEVVLELTDGSQKHLYVSDVNEIQNLLNSREIDWYMTDVPQENTLLTILLPFFWGARAAFYAEPIADIVATIMSTTAFLLIFKRHLQRRQLEW